MNIAEQKLRLQYFKWLLQDIRKPEVHEALRKVRKAYLVGAVTRLEYHSRIYHILLAEAAW